MTPARARQIRHHTKEPAMTTDTAPAPFPTTVITTDSGNLTVPCEPINDWLAITPVTGKTDDGRYVLGGTFTITHLPTGAAVADGDACINCCRASGAAIARLATADWSKLTADNAADWIAGLSEDDRQTFGLYRALEWGCDAEYCEVPAEPRPVTTVHLPTADIPA